MRVTASSFDSLTLLADDRRRLPPNKRAYDPRYVVDLQRDIPDKHLRCQQCLGEPDGKERLFPVRPHGLVLLHERCHEHDERRSESAL
jgi:hypothetical protein